MIEISQSREILDEQHDKDSVIILNEEKTNFKTKINVPMKISLINVG